MSDCDIWTLRPVGKEIFNIPADVSGILYTNSVNYVQIFEINLRSLMNSICSFADFEMEMENKTTIVMTSRF